MPKKRQNEKQDEREAEMKEAGSGRQYEHVEVVRQDRPPDVTIAELRKLHLFAGSKAAQWTKKSRRGHVTEFRAYIPVEDESLIHFGILPVDRSGKQYFFEGKVELSWSNCNLGGKRPWLLCPGRFEEPCGRRVGQLYIDGSYLVCRHCVGIDYLSNHADHDFRGLHRAQQILRRLGGSGSLAELFPPRPRYMHYATYHALYWRMHWYLENYDCTTGTIRRKREEELAIAIDKYREDEDGDEDGDGDEGEEYAEE
jgi:hypothetical protein